MKTQDVIDYFSKNGVTRGAQKRFAEECNITQQYAHKIVKSGEVPFAIQCELELRTRGKLKADRSLF